MKERTTFRHLEQYELRTLPLSPENVIYYNSLQVFQSHRYVYCPFSEFLMTAEISCEHPEMCVEDRKGGKLANLGL